MLPHLLLPRQPGVFFVTMVTNVELSREVDTLRKEVIEMRKSLEMFSSLYKKMKQDQEALAKDNKGLKKENEHSAEMLADSEQYSRINNIQIKGIPCTEDEDCSDILEKIGDKIGCPVTPADIDVVHHVPAKKDKNIIARFCLRTKKADFISKARKARLTTSDLDNPLTPAAPVFVNEHLTPDNKRLFAQALALKKEKNLKFL
ncbi:hypothetical protein HPB48_025993 [Haemaphysalis longicornis]|uniref:Uncharacterized protein n=1 Tax=Haemaphysalis longicornis TaxID=44386 RepID=A0A9J6HAA8_HAELO|nr:hypothetical protein HPB48_025993 [Haemaphysalis longicornis]